MSGTDFVGEATAELYGSEPGEFTEHRAALAARAREAGDRAAAKEIVGLRKPTRAAWVINHLVRADPGVADRLSELGDELRAAAAALDGPKIRELSQARRRLVDTLIRQALQQASEQAPSAALREDLTATFGAALADPQVARELAAGTLLRAVHRADFSPGMTGLTLVPPLGGSSPGTTPPRTRTGTEADSEATAGVAKADQHRAARKTRAAQPAKSADQAKAAAEARAAAEAKAAEARAEARAAVEAKAAEERREAFADAQRLLEEASRAAERAAQAERDQRDTIEKLENQLDDARRRLTDARRQVRETQSAEQKARRVLDRFRDR